MKQKHVVFSCLAALATATLAYTASAQTQLSGHGFTEPGAFRLMVSGNADLETSSDLQTWSKYASVTQPTGLEDLASRQADKRFYRVHGGSNIVGYLKVTVPPGKIAILGNSFASAIRLDTPDARLAVFGSTNPAVKVSLYTNGNFVAHSFDAAAGNFQPPLPPIHPQEGFSVQNTGPTPLQVRMSGLVRQGSVQTTVAPGASLVASPFPNASPATHLAEIPVKEGTQVLWFDEQTQSYQTSTFDALEPPGKWLPKLPTLPPGRAVVVKAPQAMKWTNTLSVPSTRY